MEFSQAQSILTLTIDTIAISYSGLVLANFIYGLAEIWIGIGRRQQKPTTSSPVPTNDLVEVINDYHSQQEESPKVPLLDGLSAMMDDVKSTTTPQEYNSFLHRLEGLMSQMVFEDKNITIDELSETPDFDVNDEGNVEYQDEPACELPSPVAESDEAAEEGRSNYDVCQRPDHDDEDELPSKYVDMFRSMGDDPAFNEYLLELEPPAPTNGDNPVESASPTPEPVNPDNYSANELKSWCLKLGLKGYRCMTKAEMAALITNATGLPM